MLPVATPPNAVVFGSGIVRMNDMVRRGLVMNLIGIVLVTLVCYLLGPLVFGIDFAGGVPEWALPPGTR
ncbi:MAG: anion permease [Planctomycetota bacterium]|jgi:sodium-dependent dicarboxylate transporter 2/3/5